MNKYHQLTETERYHIYGLKRAGFSISAIAKEVNRHKSTISREFKRNVNKRGWRPMLAHQLACARKLNKARKRIPQSVWNSVSRCLKNNWSPEQISGRLKIESDTSISHEWIYQFIYKDKARGGNLYRYLCRKKRYRKRDGVYETRGKLNKGLSIDERPSIVEDRQRIGDWEVDTVIGMKTGSSLVSIVDRASRLSQFIKVNTRKSVVVANVIIEQLKSLGKPVHSITADNGKEFSAFELMSENLSTDFYFAHPYSSWERGTNENTNGLMRRFFPKGSNFDKVSQSEIDAVVDKLNNRPRKCLGYKTPNEVFWNKNVALTS
jgi:IS30 family transposase